MGVVRHPIGFFRLYHHPGYRFGVKAVAVLVAMAFAFPGVSWAFDSSTYPVPSKLPASNPLILEIPHDLGVVQSAYQGSGSLVVHVQDLHCNAEVQNHIARLIDTLARERGLKLVAIEGASEPVNVMQLKNAPVRARDNAGRFFVKQGKLSGAEYYAATGKFDVRLEGIEDAQRYAESRKVVAGFLNDESQGLVYDLREGFNEVKPRVYNPALLELDRAKQANREGDLPLLKYAAKICQWGKRYGVELGRFAAVNRFVGAGNREGGEVNSEALYQELEQLDGEIRERLYTSAEQRELDTLARRLEIIERMLNISVTPAELKAYRENPGAFVGARFSDFLKRAGGLELEEEASALNEYVGKVKRFYELADERSGVFVDNTLRRMQTGKDNLAMLVTGGFHTEGVLAGLRAKNISYVSVQPRITREDVVNPYYSLLRNRKTPLEKLLAEHQNIMALPPDLPQSAVTTRELTVAEMKTQAEHVQVFAQVLDLALGAVAMGGGTLTEAGIRRAFSQAQKAMRYLEVELKSVEVHPAGKTALVRLGLGQGREVAVVVKPAGLEANLGPVFMEVADAASGRESVLLPWSAAAAAQKTLQRQAGGLSNWTAWISAPLAFFTGGAAAVAVPSSLRRLAGIAGWAGQWAPKARQTSNRIFASLRGWNRTISDFGRAASRSALNPALEFNGAFAGGEIENGFSELEKQAIRQRSEGVGEAEKKKAVGDLFRALGQSWGVTRLGGLGLLAQAGRLKNALTQQSQWQAPLRIKVGGREKKFESLGTYLEHALDLLAAPGLQLRQFPIEGQVSAVQGTEKYYLGWGQIGQLGLTYEFLKPGTPLSRHLNQALLHEALEAVTPRGATPQESRLIHRALIDQIQKRLFDADALKTDLRAFINRKDAEQQQLRLAGEVAPGKAAAASLDFQQMLSQTNVQTAFQSALDTMRSGNATYAVTHESFLYSSLAGKKFNPWEIKLAAAYMLVMFLGQAGFFDITVVLNRLSELGADKQSETEYLKTILASMPQLNTGQQERLAQVGLYDLALQVDIFTAFRAPKTQSHAELLVALLGSEAPLGSKRNLAGISQGLQYYADQAEVLKSGRSIGDFYQLAVKYKEMLRDGRNPQAKQLLQLLTTKLQVPEIETVLRGRSRTTVREILEKRLFALRADPALAGALARLGFENPGSYWGKVDPQILLGKSRDDVLAIVQALGEAGVQAATQTEILEALLASGLPMKQILAKITFMKDQRPALAAGDLVSVARSPLTSKDIAHRLNTLKYHGIAYAQMEPVLALDRVRFSTAIRYLQWINPEARSRAFWDWMQGEGTAGQLKEVIRGAAQNRATVSRYEVLDMLGQFYAPAAAATLRPAVLETPGGKQAGLMAPMPDFFAEETVEPLGLLTSAETHPGRLKYVYGYVFKTLLPELGMLLKNNPMTAAAPMIIDLGVGEGAETTRELRAELDRVNPEIQLIGVDNNPEVLESVRGIQQARLSFELGGFNLTARHQNADMVFALNVLRWYTDPAKRAEAVLEMGKALRPGGLLIEGNVDSGPQDGSKGTAGVLVYQKQPSGELKPIRLMIRYNYPAALEMPASLDPRLANRLRSDFGSARMETVREISGTPSSREVIAGVVRNMRDHGFETSSEDLQALTAGFSPDGKSLTRASFVTRLGFLLGNRGQKLWGRLLVKALEWEVTPAEALAEISTYTGRQLASFTEVLFERLFVQRIPLEEADRTRGSPVRATLGNLLQAQRMQAHPNRQILAALNFLLAAIQPGQAGPVQILAPSVFSQMSRRAQLDQDLQTLGVFNLNGTVYLTLDVFDRMENSALAAVLLHEALEVQGAGHYQAADLVEAATGHANHTLIAAAGLEKNVPVAKLRNLLKSGRLPVFKSTFVSDPENLDQISRELFTEITAFIGRFQDAEGQAPALLRPYRRIVIGDLYELAGLWGDLRELAVPFFSKVAGLEEAAKNIDALLGNHIFEQGMARGRILRAQVPGIAVGRLRIVRDLNELKTVRSDEVVVINDYPTDHSKLNVPAAIITSYEGSRGGHAAVAAKTWKIVNAVLPSAQNILNDWDGRWVRLETVGTKAVLAFASSEEIINAGKKTSAELLKKDIRVIAPDLSETRNLVDLQDAKPETAGKKTADLGRFTREIMDELNDLASEVQVRIPRGAAVPYATYQRVWDAPENAETKQALSELLRSLEFLSGDSLEDALARIRMLVRQLVFPEAVWSEIWSGLQARRLTDHVFARSTNNAEGLAEFAGAGLWSTVPNVSGEKDIQAAIKEVWSSGFNLEVYLELQKAGIDIMRVYPAVLIQEMAQSDYSMIVETANVMQRNENEVVMELIQGLGEGFNAQENIELRGRPHVLLMDKSTGQLLHAESGSMTHRVMGERNGVRIVPIDGEDRFFSKRGALTPRARAWAQAFLKIVTHIEREFNLSCNIEVGLSFTPSGVVFNLLQTRTMLDTKPYPKFYFYDIEREYRLKKARELAGKVRQKMAELGIERIDFGKGDAVLPLADVILYPANKEPVNAAQLASWIRLFGEMGADGELLMNLLAYYTVEMHGVNRTAWGMLDKNLRAKMLKYYTVLEGVDRRNYQERNRDTTSYLVRRVDPKKLRETLPLLSSYAFAEVINQAASGARKEVLFPDDVVLSDEAALRKIFRDALDHCSPVRLREVERVLNDRARTFLNPPQPTPTADSTGGAIERNFTRQEADTLLRRSQIIMAPEAARSVAQVFAVLAGKLGLTFQAGMPLSKQAALIKTALQHEPRFDAPLQVTVNYQTETLAPLRDYISAAVDMLVAPGVQFHQFEAFGEGAIRAVQGDEKYFLGRGEPGRISLIVDFFNPFSALHAHLPQAIFHEALEAATPAGGSSAERALAVHRAVIQQIQADFFNTQAMKTDLRTYIRGQSPQARAVMEQEAWQAVLTAVGLETLPAAAAQGDDAYEVALDPGKSLWLKRALGLADETLLTAVKVVFHDGRPQGLLLQTADQRTYAGVAIDMAEGDNAVDRDAAEKFKQLDLKRFVSEGTQPGKITPFALLEWMNVKELGVVLPRFAGVFRLGSHSSRVMREHVQVLPGQRICDLGCGMGINAILAARQGASEVVALDINALAVANVRFNAQWTGSTQVKAYESNLLQVKGVEDIGKFDQIFFVSPMANQLISRLYDVATNDPDYLVITRAFSEMKAHLTPAGHVMLYYLINPLLVSLVSRFQYDIQAITDLDFGGLYEEPTVLMNLGGSAQRETPETLLARLLAGQDSQQQLAIIAAGGMGEAGYRLLQAYIRMHPVQNETNPNAVIQVFKALARLYPGLNSDAKTEIRQVLQAGQAHFHPFVAKAAGRFLDKVLSANRAAAIASRTAETAQKPKTPLSLGFWISLLLDPHQLNRAVDWGKRGLWFEIPALIAAGVLLGVSGSWFWMGGVLAFFALVHEAARWQVDRVLNSTQTFRQYAARWLKSLLTLSPYFFMSGFFGWHYPILAFFTGAAAALIQSWTDLAKFETVVQQQLDTLPDAAFQKDVLPTARAFADDFEARRWHEFVRAFSGYVMQPETGQEELLAWKARALDESLEVWVRRFFAAEALGEAQAQIQAWQALNAFVMPHGLYVTGRVALANQRTQVTPYLYRIEKAETYEGITTLHLRALPGKFTMEALRFFDAGKGLVVLNLGYFEKQALRTVLPLWGGYVDESWQSAVFGKDAWVVKYFIESALSKVLSPEEMQQARTLAVLLSEREAVARSFTHYIDNEPGVQKMRAIALMELPLVLSESQIADIEAVAKEAGVELPKNFASANRQISAQSGTYAALLKKIALLLADPEETQKFAMATDYDETESYWMRLTTARHFGLDLALLLREALMPDAANVSRALFPYFAVLSKNLGMTRSLMEAPDFAEVLAGVGHLEESDPESLEMARQETSHELSQMHFDEKMAAGFFRKAAAPGPEAVGREIGRSAEVIVSGNQVTFRVRGQEHSFVRGPLMNINSTNLAAPGTPHQVALYAYTMPLAPGIADDKLEGVRMEAGFEGRGFLRPLLNLFFTEHPEVRQTSPSMQNLIVLDFLMREYGFGLKDSGAQPNVWIREFDPASPEARAGKRVQVYFSDPQLALKFKASAPEEMQALYEYTEQKREGFRPLVLGQILQVQDARKFSEALASLPVRQTGLGSVLDRWFQQSGVAQRHPIGYRLYTKFGAGVLEVAYSVPGLNLLLHRALAWFGWTVAQPSPWSLRLLALAVPAGLLLTAMYLVPFLGPWSLVISLGLLGIWADQAALYFARAHSELLVKEQVWLYVLGMALTLSLFMPAVIYTAVAGAAFAWALFGKMALLGLGLNFALHALNNVLALLGRSAWMRALFPQWADRLALIPAATVAGQGPVVRTEEGVLSVELAPEDDALETLQRVHEELKSRLERTRVRVMAGTPAQAEDLAALNFSADEPLRAAQVDQVQRALSTMNKNNIRAADVRENEGVVVVALQRPLAAGERTYLNLSLQIKSKEFRRLDKKLQTQPEQILKALRQNDLKVAPWTVPLVFRPVASEAVADWPSFMGEKEWEALQEAQAAHAPPPAAPGAVAAQPEVKPAAEEAEPDFSAEFRSLAQDELKRLESHWVTQQIRQNAGTLEFSGFLKALQQLRRQLQLLLPPSLRKTFEQDIDFRNMLKRYHDILKRITQEKRRFTPDRLRHYLNLIEQQRRDAGVYLTDLREYLAIMGTAQDMGLRENTTVPEVFNLITLYLVLLHTANKRLQTLAWEANLNLPEAQQPPKFKDQIVQRTAAGQAGGFFNPDMTWAMGQLHVRLGAIHDFYAQQGALFPALAAPLDRAYQDLDGELAGLEINGPQFSARLHGFFDRLSTLVDADVNAAWAQKEKRPMAYETLLRDLFEASRQVFVAAGWGDIDLVAYFNLGALGDLAPLAQVGTAGSVEIDGLSVTFSKEGKDYSFEFLPINQISEKGFGLNYYGFGGKHDDYAGEPDIFIYHQQDKDFNLQPGLKGMLIQPLIQGEGLMSFVLNLFFFRFPEIRRTHHDIKNLLLLSTLIHRYGFGPEQPMEPNAWIKLPERRLPSKEFKARVYFSKEDDWKEYISFDKGASPSMLAQYERVMEKDDTYLPLYYQVPLVVKDEAKFQAELAKMPMKVLQPLRGRREGSQISAWLSASLGLAAPVIALGAQMLYSLITRQPLQGWEGWMTLPAAAGLPLLGAGLLKWLAQALGERAGPLSQASPFLRWAEADAGVLFFEVQNNTLKVNPTVRLGLLRLPVWMQNVLLYGLGIVGHESWHLRGHAGRLGEFGAYGLMQVLPALLGAWMFGGLIGALGLAAGWTALAGVLGAALVTGLVGWVFYPVARAATQAARGQNAFYSRLVNPGASISAGYNQPALKKIFRTLPFAPDQPLRILDLGSGLGYNLKTILEQYPNARVVSSDYNTEILALSKSLLSQSAVEKRRSGLKKLGFNDSLVDGLAASRPENPKVWENQVEFMTGDAQHFASASGVYDLVICTEMLEHVGDPEQAMREMGRLLKPGGYVVASTPNYAWNFAGLMKRFFDWRAGMSFWDPWGGHHTEGQFGRENYMTASRLEKGFKAQGFKITQTLGLNFWLSWLTPFMIYVFVKLWPVMAYRLQDRFAGFFLNALPVPLKKTAMSYFVVAEKLSEPARAFPAGSGKGEEVDEGRDRRVTTLSSFQAVEPRIPLGRFSLTPDQIGKIKLVVTAILAAGLLAGGISNLVFGLIFLPGFYNLLIVYPFAWLGTSKLARGEVPINTAYFANRPLKENPGPADLKLGISVMIPVYTENFDIIKENIFSALKAVRKYNESSPAGANLVVCDDALMVWAGNDLRRVEELGRLGRAEAMTSDEQLAWERIRFYRDHAIAWVARPKPVEGVAETQRPGVFKKGSNLNHAMRLAEETERLQQEHSGLTPDQALNQALSSGRFGYSRAEGDIRIRDVILLLDKDGYTPEDALVLTAPEFAHDPALAYTQHRIKPINEQESMYTRLQAQNHKLQFEFVIPNQALQGSLVTFVGHNGFIRTDALKKLGYWNEDAVAEDYDLAMRANTAGYHGKYIAYEANTFGEYLSSEPTEDIGKFQRYAFGTTELVFNPVPLWFSQGLFKEGFRRFLKSPDISPWKKADWALKLTLFVFGAMLMPLLTVFMVAGISFSPWMLTVSGLAWGWFIAAKTWGLLQAKPGQKGVLDVLANLGLVIASGQIYSAYLWTMFKGLLNYMQGLKKNLNPSALGGHEAENLRELVRSLSLPALDNFFFLTAFFYFAYTWTQGRTGTDFIYQILFMPFAARYLFSPAFLRQIRQILRERYWQPLTASADAVQSQIRGFLGEGSAVRVLAHDRLTVGSLISGGVSAVLGLLVAMPLAFFGAGFLMAPFTGQTLTRFESVIVALGASLPVLGAALIEMAAWKLGKRPGRAAAQSVFLQSAQDDPLVSFFEVKGDVIKVNATIRKGLSRLPVWLQNVVLYGLGIAGHESWHLRGHIGWLGELGAYGLMQVLPALAGALITGALAGLVAAPSVLLVVASTAGAFGMTYWVSRLAYRRFMLPMKGYESSGGFINSRGSSAPNPVESAPEVLSLLTVLGQTGMNEDVFSQHPLGRLLRDRRDIFGARDDKFLLNHVFFQAGLRFALEERLAPGQVNSTDMLDENQVELVLTVPEALFRTLQSQADQAKGALKLSSQDQADLNRVLDEYAQETKRLALEKAAEEREEQAWDAVALYGGYDIQFRTLDQLKRLGAMSNREFYAVSRGKDRRLGTSPMEIFKLLTLTLPGFDVWKAIQGPLSQLLPEGHAPSPAMLVQAFLSLENAQDPAMRAAARVAAEALAIARQNPDPRLLAAEVKQIAEWINYSKNLTPETQMKLLTALQAVAGEAEAVGDEVLWLMDKGSRATLRTLVADAEKASTQPAVLEMVKNALSHGSVSDARLQKLLQTLTPEALHVALVGADEGKKPASYVASLSPGRVDVEKVRFKVGGTPLAVEVSSPAVASLWADQPEAFAAFLLGGDAAQTMAVLPYGGQLQEPLPVGMVKEFKQAFETLGSAAFFRAQGRLEREGALARNYFQQHQPGALVKAKADRESSVRVLLRMLAMEGKAMGNDAARQRDFDEALASVNRLLSEGQAYQGVRRALGVLTQTVRGREQATIIYAPEDLSLGALRRYIALWERNAGFTLNKDWEDRLRRIQLRNFRVESAA